MSDPVQPTRVGIGLIGRGGSYLVRRRLPGQAMAGLWEFPGGKCERGESPERATARECLEETGREIEVGPLVYRTVHRYPHGLIELSYYDGSFLDPEAEPAPRSGFTWVAADDLPDLTFPDANGPVVAILVARSADGLEGTR